MLPGRRCKAAVPPVVSGNRRAFRSPDAAHVLPHMLDLPLAAVAPVVLDGGLGLSGTQNNH